MQPGRFSAGARRICRRRPKFALPLFGALKAKKGRYAGYVSTLVKIQAAFEHAGIQFIDDDALGGFGVRMAKKKRKAMTLSRWYLRKIFCLISPKCQKQPGQQTIGTSAEVR